MSYYNSGVSMQERWIIDSGASDHMTPYSDIFVDVVQSVSKSKINLPNGKRVNVMCQGTLNVGNNLQLQEVLCVTEFNHNLFSVNKVIKQNNCNVIFFPKSCVIQDYASREIKAVGQVCNGIYYLVDDVDRIQKKVKRKVNESLEKNLGIVSNSSSRVEVAVNYVNKRDKCMKSMKFCRHLHLSSLGTIEQVDD
ncbi:Retrovirus-related Pol polyprotein from transposon RE2 [Bienertia sinuspersici]